MKFPLISKLFQIKHQLKAKVPINHNHLYWLREHLIKKLLLWKIKLINKKRKLKITIRLWKMGLRNDLFYGLFYFYASYIDVGEYDIYYDIMIE